MTPSEDTLRLGIWHGLLFGQRSMMLRFAAALKSEFGLTLAQFEALQVLAHAAPDAVTPTALSRALLYSSGSTTNLVKQLEARGLATRTTAPDDARGVQIALTERGAALIADASASHRRRVEREFFPLVPDDELSTLRRFTGALADAEDLASLPHFPSTDVPHHTTAEETP